MLLSVLSSKLCGSAGLCHGYRGSERGTARPEVLKSLLQSTERVVQEIDSVEYGLTDIQVSDGSSVDLMSAVPFHTLAMLPNYGHINMPRKTSLHFALIMLFMGLETP